METEARSLIVTTCRACGCVILENELAVTRTLPDTIEDFCDWDCLDFQKRQERDRKTA